LPPLKGIPDNFGLEEVEVSRRLEGLPDAEACHEYQFVEQKERNTSWEKEGNKVRKEREKHQSKTTKALEREALSAVKRAEKEAEKEANKKKRAGEVEANKAKRAEEREAQAKLVSEVGALSTSAPCRLFSCPPCNLTTIAHRASR